MSIRVNRMSGSTGAEVVGADLVRADTATLDALRAAFLEHHVLAIRGQDLSPHQLLSFAAEFGEVFVHPYVPSLTGHPGVMEIYQMVPLTETWHADVTFSAAPPRTTVLHARELPPAGGDTMFANQHLAYERLSPGLRRVLDGLTAVHQGTSLAADAGLTESTVTATHPVVVAHPETGRPALYVNADYTRRFADMTDEESAPLLAYLYEAATRHEFAYRHRWLPGDVVMWDNRSVQHRGVNDYGSARRYLHRVTLEGSAPRPFSAAHTARSTDAADTNTADTTGGTDTAGTTVGARG
ncbi:TauD/TfdA dioxygenase family protein [Streptodolium elevatio]